MSWKQKDTQGAVIIGSDFRALGVARSLGRQSVPCVIVDNLHRAAWFSRYVLKRYKWCGKMDTLLFLHYLITIAKEQHFERWVLIPTTDDVVELIARNTQQLAQVYQLVTPAWEIVRWANDKRLTYQMAHELGVPCPETWYPTCEEHLRALPIIFPAIIKSAISIHLHRALQLKALPANNYEELLAQYRIAARLLKADEILVQEMIPGDGCTQYSVGAFCKEGRLLLAMTARRTRQYPIDYGLNSCFVEALEMPQLFEPTSKLLRYMRLSGMVEIEFKYDRRNGQYRLLDINARPWGWHSLCRSCGLDFPYIQYCDAQGQPPCHVVPRYGQHWVRLLTDIPAGIQEMRAGVTTPGAYLRSLLNSTTFSVFDWRDPLPALGDIAAIGLSRSLKKLQGGRTHA
jgi:predicted ATP-grasp superfamily ATP-dependent carboligase